MGLLKFFNGVSGKSITFPNTEAGFADAKRFMGEQLRNEKYAEPLQKFQADAETASTMNKLYGPAKREW